MSAKFAYIRNDGTPFYWDGSTATNIAGASFTPTYYGGSWTNPLWKVGSGRLVFCMALAQEFNSNTVSQAKARTSDNNGSSWGGHGAGTGSGDRLYNVNIGSGAHRMWPPSVAYSDDNDRLCILGAGLVDTGTDSRQVHSRSIDPDTLTGSTELEIDNATDKFYYNHPDNPDTNDEVNIVGIGTFFEDVASEEKEIFIYEKNTTDIEVHFRLTDASFVFGSPPTLFTKSSSNPIGGVCAFGMQDQDDGRHAVYIYADNRDNGTLYWSHIRITDFAGGIWTTQKTAAELFPNKVYNGLNSGNRTGGNFSAFYDKDARLIHCWLKNSDDSVEDYSLYYTQIDCSVPDRYANGLDFRKSHVHLVDTFDSSTKDFSINGGVQDGEVKVLVYNGDTGEVTEYTKGSSVTTWTDTDTVSLGSVWQRAIAWILVDYDTASNEVFDNSAPLGSGTSGRLRFRDLDEQNEYIVPRNPDRWS